jgi:glycosyltransferase involved in cell wall biosynthesis
MDDNTFATARPRIDVIMRTLADKARERNITRALDGIQSLSSVDARPVVVVNGDRYHPPLLQALRARSGMIVHYLSEASAVRARTEGRRLVTAPWFMFLDDDDELIASGMAQLAEHIVNHVDWDVLITNGYFSADGERRPMYLDLNIIAAHPLRSLVAEGWLCPGASVFRTASIDVDLLDVQHFHQEWTHIAFRLVMAKKRINFLDVPTGIYYDTEGSASKSHRHQEEAVRLLEEMMADPEVDPETLTVMKRKYRNMLHILAVQHWRRGHLRQAWRYHLRSMRWPFTFKYLLFSRKLLVPRRRSA